MRIGKPGEKPSEQGENQQHEIERRLQNNTLQLVFLGVSGKRKTEVFITTSPASVCTSYSCLFIVMCLPVAVNGNWAVWGRWSVCSKTCGGGSMKRTRTCSNPAPKHGGRKCQGSSQQYVSCNDQSCPTGTYVISSQ